MVRRKLDAKRNGRRWPERCHDVARTSSRRDIVECALFIAEDRPAAAERFLDAVEETVRRLAEQSERLPRSA